MMLVPTERIEQAILQIRGQKVMLDSDLAELFGVQTKVLNQAVKRNLNRFPEDFMFQLTSGEKDEVVTNCDHLQNLKFSSVCPYAFTEHGAVMVATVLNTPRAVEVSLAVVRTFVKLREMVASHKDLAEKLKAMEQKYDGQFRVVFDALRQLMSSDEVEKESIGFKVKDTTGAYQ